MPRSNSAVLSDIAVEQINSLGGPPLPMGVTRQTLRTIMENVSASQMQVSSCHIAQALAARFL